MLTTIGLIICAYVAFRAIEAIVNVGEGGAYDAVAGYSQVIIVLLALCLIIFAVVCGYSLVTSANEATNALKTMPVFGE